MAQLVVGALIAGRLDPTRARARWRLAYCGKARENLKVRFLREHSTAEDAGNDSFVPSQVLPLFQGVMAPTESLLSGNLQTVPNVLTTDRPLKKVRKGATRVAPFLWERHRLLRIGQMFVAQVGARGDYLVLWPVQVDLFNECVGKIARLCCIS